MALRKFLFLNPSEGFSEEQQPTDELSLGKATFSGVGGIAIDGGNQRATNFAAPTAASDLTNKAYVDALSQGISWKNPARAATTTILPTVTYANGTAGVGATLTATANGALSAQDGVTLVLNDRLLVKDQAAGLQNGIYFVSQVGSGGTPFILTRSLDDDIAAEQSAAAAFVMEGSTLADSAFVQTVDQPITMGTTALTWVLFTSTQTITASTGLVKVGNDIRVKKGDGIEVVSNSGSTNVDISGTDPGLQFAGASPNGTLEVKVDTANGIDKGAGGVFAKTATSVGTTISGGNIAVSPDANGGIQNTGSGLAVKLNGTTLSSGASGLAVDHAPEVTRPFTASGAIAAFAGVYISGNNVVSTGDAGVDAKSRIVGLAKAGISNTSTGDVIYWGRLAGALTGATFNTPYYLDDSTGLPVIYSALGSAKRVIRLGWALNATDLFVDIQDIGKKA